MTQSEPKQGGFNPAEHMMKLKSKDGLKDYLPVQYRILWFRDQCPNGTIDTEELEYDLDREIEAEVFVWNAEKRRSEKVTKRAKGYARYRAVVTDGKGGVASGTKSESAVNFADYGEKAETGSVGRALAMLGYGTAGAPELNEGERIVDSPIEQGNKGHEQSGNGDETSEIVTEVAIMAAQKAAITAGIIDKSWQPAQRSEMWKRLIIQVCGSYITPDKMTVVDLGKVTAHIAKQQKAG